MSAQVEIGYIDHFDDTFDYSYSGEALSYPKICELHHCVPVPEEVFSQWALRLPELPTCFCSAKRPGRGLDVCGV